MSHNRYCHCAWLNHSNSSRRDKTDLPTTWPTPLGSQLCTRFQQRLLSLKVPDSTCHTSSKARSPTPTLTIKIANDSLPPFDPSTNISSDRLVPLAPILGDQTAHTSRGSSPNDSLTTTSTIAHASEYFPVPTAALSKSPSCSGCVAQAAQPLSRAVSSRSSWQSRSASSNPRRTSSPNLVTVLIALSYRCLTWSNLLMKSDR